MQVIGYGMDHKDDNMTEKIEEVWETAEVLLLAQAKDYLAVMESKNERVSNHIPIF